MTARQKIMAHLGFDANAEQAASFYVPLFKDSRITHVLRYGKGDPGREGSVMSIGFELDGQTFGAVNGGLSWQTGHSRFLDLAADKDPAGRRRLSEALFGMKKVDIAALESAYAGA